MANNAVCVQNIVMSAAVLTLSSGYFKDLPGMLGGQCISALSRFYHTIWIRSSCLRRQCAAHQL